MLLAISVWNAKILTPVMHSTDTKFNQNENTEIGVNYVLYFANIIQKLYQVI
jgi:hypothetical protein